MSACLPPELELMEKHEEILDRRAELLEQTESRRERLKIQMKKMVQESEAARQRNSALLQDLQQIEDRLRGKRLPSPDLLALESEEAAINQLHLSSLGFSALLKGKGKWTSTCSATSPYWDLNYELSYCSPTRTPTRTQMRYWTSVEESVPAWESFLLSKGPHPTDGPEQQARRPKHKPSTAKDRGLPPRPQPRTAR